MFNTVEHYATRRSLSLEDGEMASATGSQPPKIPFLIFSIVNSEVSIDFLPK